MTQTHTSYEFSRKLKAFLGESAPKPMSQSYSYDKGGHKTYPKYTRYQLHDLLSKPFCEAMAEKLPQFKKSMGWGVHYELSEEHFNGGLPAVEKALTEMMEEK